MTNTTDLEKLRNQIKAEKMIRRLNKRFDKENEKAIVYHFAGYPCEECPDCEHWNERDLTCGANWIEIALAPCAGVESLFDSNEEESEGDE